MNRPASLSLLSGISWLLAWVAAVSAVVFLTGPSCAVAQEPKLVQESSSYEQTVEIVFKNEVAAKKATVRMTPLYNKECLLGSNRLYQGQGGIYTA